MQDFVSQEMTLITADKPILVMQYVKDRNLGAGDGAMTRVISIEQFVTKTVIPVYVFPDTQAHIGITTQCEKIGNLSMSKDNVDIQVNVV